MSDLISMRAEVAEEFEVFLAEYEKAREARGLMPLEKFVTAHMHAAWQASRQAVVVELPEPQECDEGWNWIDYEDACTAIQAAGLRTGAKP